ncbi:MAG: hypothetical protein ACE5KT_12380, partial [Methanosarcinales archaeon]
SKSNMANTQNVDAGNWITLSTTSLTVPASGTATFVATMNVPSTAKGSYKGRITVNNGVKNIVIPVSVNVMQRVDNTTVEDITGIVDEDRHDGWCIGCIPPTGIDQIYYILDVQPGIKKLNISLNWNNVPTTDLDLYIFNPENMWSAWSGEWDKPENLVVNNPEAGKWTVLVSTYELAGYPSETYTLTVNATGQDIDLEITDFTIDPEIVEKGSTATFTTNITNKKDDYVYIDKKITIYAITANGREKRDELSITKSIAPGENTLIDTWTAWPSQGTYEATTQVFYQGSGQMVTEKTISFNISSTTQVISTDENGTEKNAYHEGDSVYVKAIRLSPNTNYTIWIQNDPVKDREKLKPNEDPSGSQEVVTTDSNGNLTNTLIWNYVPTSNGARYDIVLDKAGEGEGRYNAAYDGIDDILIYGFETVPEFPTMIVPSAIALLIVFLMFRKKRKK